MGKYNIKFDLFEKINVNGSEAHPLYKFLQNAVPGTLINAIKWNYTKFLTDRNGVPIHRYSPTTSPLSNPEAKSKLQFCHTCNGYKPPRAHHCRSCKRCVMKMDHHCPWINSCCGHLNHGYFLHFLLFVPAGCLTCAIVLALSVYRYWHVLPYVFASRNPNAFSEVMLEMCLALFAFGLSVGVILAVGALAVFQIMALLKNQTAIESWIVAKAKHRRTHSTEDEKPFVYPYDLGRRTNILKVLSWSGDAHGDGIHWSFRDDCGEYDFTIEQIRQKEMKDLIRRDYRVHRLYNGRYCPCWQFGCRVSLDTPYPDETRIAVTTGDRLSVTRWSKHWIYGELQTPSKPVENGTTPSSKTIRPRGWIPRQCAKEVPP